MSWNIYSPDCSEDFLETDNHCNDRAIHLCSLRGKSKVKHHCVALEFKWITMYSQRYIL